MRPNNIENLTKEEALVVDLYYRYNNSLEEITKILNLEFTGVSSIFVSAIEKIMHRAGIDKYYLCDL